MIETKVTCDGCYEEIDTTTSYSGEAYVEIRPVWKTNPGGYSYAMRGDVPIENSCQFHNLNCLDEFLQGKV